MMLLRDLRWNQNKNLLKIAFDELHEPTDDEQTLRENSNGIGKS